MEANVRKWAVEDAESIMRKAVAGSNLVVSPYVQIDDRTSYALVRYGVKTFLNGHHLPLINRQMPGDDFRLETVDKIDFKKGERYESISHYSETLKGHLDNYNVKMSDLKIDLEPQLFG